MSNFNADKARALVDAAKNTGEDINLIVDRIKKRAAAGHYTLQINGGITEYEEARLREMGFDLAFRYKKGRNEHEVVLGVAICWSQA